MLPGRYPRRVKVSVSKVLLKPLWSSQLIVVYKIFVYRSINAFTWLTKLHWCHLPSNPDLEFKISQIELTRERQELWTLHILYETYLIGLPRLYWCCDMLPNIWKLKWIDKTSLIPCCLACDKFASFAKGSCNFVAIAKRHLRFYSCHVSFIIISDILDTVDDALIAYRQCSKLQNYKSPCSDTCTFSLCCP